MIICLDACVVIYWVEMAQPYYDSFINKLSKIAQEFPNAEIAISRLTLLECNVNPLRNKDQNLLKQYQIFFNRPELKIIEIDANVVELATKIRAHSQLKTPDAIQAASALSLEKSVFISNDKSFKQVKELPVYLI